MTKDEDFIQFGEGWRREMKKYTKDELINKIEKAYRELIEFRKFEKAIIGKNKTHANN